MVVTLLLTTLFGLIGVLLAAAGISKFRASRIIDRGETSPQGRAGERVFFSGTVAGDATTTAPLSGEACLAYRLVHEVESGRNDTHRWSQRGEVTELNGFVVDEGSAQVRVDADLVAEHDALFDFGGNTARRGVSSRDEVPRSVERTGVLDDDGLSSLNADRLVERRLEHGDTLYCVGKTERAAGDADVTHRFLVDGNPTTASNESREAFETDNSAALAAVFFLGGSVTALVCGTYVLSTLGVV